MFKRPNYQHVIFAFFQFFKLSQDRLCQMRGWNIRVVVCLLSSWRAWMRMVVAGGQFGRGSSRYGLEPSNVLIIEFWQLQRLKASRRSSVHMLEARAVGHCKHCCSIVQSFKRSSSQAFSFAIFPGIGFQLVKLSRFGTCVRHLGWAQVRTLNF